MHEDDTMQTEPTITTSYPMSAEDAAVWIIEKAKYINHLQALRARREKAVLDHQRKLNRLDKEIAELESLCAIEIKQQ